MISVARLRILIIVFLCNSLFTSIQRSFALPSSIGIFVKKCVRTISVMGLKKTMLLLQPFVKSWGGTRMIWLLFLFYHKGVLFSIVRFYWTCSNTAVSFGTAVSAVKEEVGKGCIRLSYGLIFCRAAVVKQL